MSWRKLRSFAGEQFQRVNPAIVRHLIRLRAQKKPFSLSPGPVIVFSPHKDDEVLGCGGMIIQKRRLGAELYIVFMTDGRASHQSRYITPAELAALRTVEARACARVMGVPEKNLIFLEFEERFLGRHQAEAQSRVREILRDIQPVEVFVPYHREAQADHCETNRIVRQALREIYGKDRLTVTFYEYFVWTMRLWFWQITELYRSPNWRRIDVRNVRQIKKRALACYKSQTTALYPDPRWPVLPKDLLTWFSQPWEYFLKNV